MSKLREDAEANTFANSRGKIYAHSRFGLIYIYLKIKEPSFRIKTVRRASSRKSTTLWEKETSIPKNADWKITPNAGERKYSRAQLPWT